MNVLHQSSTKCDSLPDHEAPNDKLTGEMMEHMIKHTVNTVKKISIRMGHVVE